MWLVHFSSIRLERDGNGSTSSLENGLKRYQITAGTLSSIWSPPILIVDGQAVPGLSCFSLFRRFSSYLFAWEFWKTGYMSRIALLWIGCLALAGQSLLLCWFLRDSGVIWVELLKMNVTVGLPIMTTFMPCSAKLIISLIAGAFFPNPWIAPSAILSEWEPFIRNCSLKRFYLRRRAPLWSYHLPSQNCFALCGTEGFEFHQTGWLSLWLYSSGL